MSQLRAQGLDDKCEALGDLLKRLIADNLRDKGATTANLSPAGSIAANLGWVELDDAYLSEHTWFKQFPESIPMACAVETFHVIESML